MLLRGGRVVDPSQSLDALRDVRIAQGRVDEIGERLELRADEDLYDVSGTVVAPGFIDMHVHLRDPGFPEKETIASGVEAAVRGGFSAVACMPNTSPAIDAPQVIAYIAEAARTAGRARVYCVGAITHNREGVKSCDFARLTQAGAVAFSDDGSTVMNARVLRDAALDALAVPGVFISHCEDTNLKSDGVMHDGSVSRALGVVGSPALAEESIVARDLLIATETAKAWHIAHVTTARALAEIAHAREAGAHATCEVTPHHLLLTDECVREHGAAAKVNPPLRIEADARALRDAVRDGRIDVFATDHAPHTLAEKTGDLQSAAVGFSGLEIAIGAYALALPDLPLPRFVAMLSTNPARILGVPGGTLLPGSSADITIFAERPWRADPSQFASKGKSTPFAGYSFARKPLATIVGGEIMFCCVSA